MPLLPPINIIFSLKYVVLYDWPPTKIESPRGFQLRAEPGIEYRKPPIDIMLIFIYSHLGR